MKKTYATSMPNHIGAFLKASKCFAELGINITRVSYDKSVDSHMLFLDVEGTEEQIRKADALLEEIGYLQDNAGDSSIVLIEFLLEDVPGSVTAILELINAFNFNISYINSQENGTDYQQFKMGLHIEDPGRITAFMEQAEQAAYNQYAPILMTSVDTDPQLCARERKAIMSRLGVGNWKIFGAHGAPKEYCVK